METATHPSAATLAHWEKKAPAFLALDLETRAAVDTATAAFHLNRQPQTLRGWACHEDGPLRPVRVHGRLAWKVADLRRLMGVASMKTPALPEGQTSAREQGDSKTPASFLGTDNPRHLRVIQAGLVRPMPREHLDAIAGCSNGPELVAELRRRGLEMPCTRTRKLDRDLFDCWPGVYHFTQQDRRKLASWKRTRAAGRVQK